MADNFWDSTKESIQNQFTKGRFAEGLIEGIHLVGEQLKHYFPWSEDDSNELPNTISKS